MVKCQFDWDDGRAQYEVEIRNGWTEYEFEIDAVTGTIFSRDIDNDRW
ncbi:MAG: PepSY domain-containing protein [Oscillospiraceae bacterium]